MDNHANVALTELMKDFCVFVFYPDKYVYIYQHIKNGIKAKLKGLNKIFFHDQNLAVFKPIM